MGLTELKKFKLDLNAFNVNCDWPKQRDEFMAGRICDWKNVS